MDLQDARDVALIVAAVVFVITAPIALYILLSLTRALLRLVASIDVLSVTINENLQGLVGPLVGLRRALEAAGGPISSAAGFVGSLFRGGDDEPRTPGS